jgi:hypothetical protein
VKVSEQVWKADGKIERLYCKQAGVNPRGSSRRMHKALADFGAHESFAQAARRMKEHYGLDVS